MPPPEEVETDYHRDGATTTDRRPEVGSPNVQSASSSPTSTFRTHLDGFVEVARRLHDHYGVVVDYAALPAHDISTFDADRRTVVLRADAHLEDQLWALREWLNLITYGASLHARPHPALRLVPAQRIATG